MKKTIFILITGLFLIFPVISQAIIVFDQDPALSNAEVITDAYGNPEAIKITCIFFMDCNQFMYDQITEMDNTVLVQIFVESTSAFCSPADQPFTVTHTVEIDPSSEISSITVGLYNGTPETDGVVEVFGDPIVIAGINNEKSTSEEVFINITPTTLNLNSKGRFITVSIELPAEYDNENMILETVKMENKIEAEKILKKDDVFIAKFNRDEVIDFLSVMEKDLPTKVELGLEFEFSGDNGLLTVKAQDTIKLIKGRERKQPKYKEEKELKMNKGKSH